MTQGELEQIPEEVVRQISELEQRIMEDIVRKIKENGFSGAASDWQINRLQQLRMTELEIKSQIAEALEATEAEIDRIFSDEVYREYYGHERAYRMSDVKQVPFEENRELQELITAIKQQTGASFQNITASMGFVIRTPGDAKLSYQPLRDFYTSVLDAAMWDISTGAFDYNTVLRRTVEAMTVSGIRKVDYASGTSRRIDVAARSAIMTGFRQLQGKINAQVARELNTDHFEVTFHVGARPTHQPWQGRVWSKAELMSVCGLGTAGGLHGVNCYHDYNAFIPGISTRSYTDAQLEQLIAEENTPKEYNGREYTTYEALQQQRKQERAMCKTRQDIKLMEAGGASAEEVILKKAKYQGQMQTYVDFSEKMKLPQQMDRVYQDGLRGKFTLTKAEKAKMDIAKATGSGIIEQKRRIPQIPASTISKNVSEGKYSLTLSKQQYEKHVLGSKKYMEYRASRELKGGNPQSILTIDADKVQDIINKKHGTGIVKCDRKGNALPQEKITCDTVIGQYYAKGEYHDTNKAVIHYSKNGAHLVPIRGDDYD